MLTRFFLLTLTIVAVGIVPAFSQWNLDPTINTPVCTATGWQSSATVLPDGNGGTFVIWMDGRVPDSHGYYRLYAQHITSRGERLWVKNGIQICGEIPNGELVFAELTKQGGFILVWERAPQPSLPHKRNLSVQSIGSGGAMQWRRNAVLPYYHNSGEFYSAVSDGDCGVVFAQSYVVEGNHEIYAQRIDADGNRKWPTAGLRICGGPGLRRNPVLLPGKNGCTYIAWEEDRDTVHDKQRYDV
jgi:hypothetical protein